MGPVDTISSYWTIFINQDHDQSSPEVMLPIPLMKAKMENTNGGAIGSSSTKLTISCERHSSLKGRTAYDPNHIWPQRLETGPQQSVDDGKNDQDSWVHPKSP